MKEDDHDKFFQILMNEDSQDNKRIFRNFLRKQKEYNISKVDLQDGLIYACLWNTTYYIKKLLKENIDINYKDKHHNCAIYVFSQFNNNTETLKLLLEHGANPLIEDDEKRNSIKIARLNKNNKVAEMLEKYTQALILLAPKYNNKHNKSQLRHIPPELSRKVINFLF